MPPLTPQRKRLTNEEKLKIIEESKKPGFCRKKTMEKYGISRSGLSVILLKQKEFLRTMDSCPISPKSKSQFYPYSSHTPTCPIVILD